MSNYDINLDKNRANYIPLTPLTFLERAKDVYPNYEAIVYEDRKYTWSEVYKRAVRFASALEKIGISKGDTVSFLVSHSAFIISKNFSIIFPFLFDNFLNTKSAACTEFVPS